MSSSTPNFNLTKPAGSENVDISTINSNMDKLDAGVEPVHAVQTVTGTNGSITISNALDVPFIDFTVQGAGTPGVYYEEGVTASAQGQQTWDIPLVLDVPLSVADADYEIISSCYGYGVGNNSYSVTAGTETGTTVYLNSKDLSALFSGLDNSGEGTVTTETSTYLFECPLPFSVATGTTVYCSHLKEQNVADTEGVWASGNTLYLRISTARCRHGRFSDLKSLMDDFAADSLFYMDMGENPFDFFVCVTASESYTKQGNGDAIQFADGTRQFSYEQIGVELIEDEPIPVPTLSVTYFINSTVNRAQANSINNAIVARFKTGAVGNGAVTTGSGGAVGVKTSADGGGAVGAMARVNLGGAVGLLATAGSGGAVGSGAKTTDGAAVGRNAICEDGNGDAIDAIQLGEGTYSTAGSMQVYSTPLLIPDGNGGLVIPPALLIASVGAMTAQEKTDFKTALGIS